MNDQNFDQTREHFDEAAKHAEEAATNAKEALESKAAEAKASAESFAESAGKIAAEAGYAVAGFAGLVGEKAKAFYEEQKKQYADSHPEADKDPGAKAFLDQLSEHLNRFVEDLTKGYREMAERGRDVVKRRAADVEAHAEETSGTETPVSHDPEHHAGTGI